MGYLVNKYALWLDFRTIDENELHGTGRQIENTSVRITIQIEKKTESAGALNTFLQYTKMFMKEQHTGLFVAPTGVGKHI